MFRATHTPPLNFLMDDLLTTSPVKIASHLEVTPKTLLRWQAANAAPRPVMLALFYETRWGSSLVHAEAHNGRMYAENQVRGLERENAALRTRIARLEAIGDFGAANAPRLVAMDAARLPIAI